MTEIPSGSAVTAASAVFFGEVRKKMKKFEEICEKVLTRLA